MTDQQTRVAVGLSDALPDVLNRLQKAASTTVALEIPAESSLFLTASEFRALQAAADRDRIAITVATDDPLRQQLAALFKLPVAAPIAGPEPEPAEQETVTSTTTPPPEPAATEEAESTAEGIAQTDAPPPELRRGRWGGIAVPTRLSRATDRIRATTRRQRLIAAVAVVAVFGLAYLGAYLFLARATVVLTLERQAISRSVGVAVAAPGAAAPAADVTIAATPVGFPVSTSQTVNATGTKTVGDATAQGKVSLSNPTNKPVTVEAGTQLEDKLSGTKYAVVATVELPAGKAGAPAFGEAAVTCLEPGTVGNRDTGLLSGLLASGVYFSNRQGPIAGGTDKQTAVVAQADLDAVKAQALDALKAQAAAQSPGASQVVLAPSIQLGEPSFTADHRVGDASPTLTVQASAQATGLAYDPTELHDRVADTLNAAAPAGYELDRSSVQLSDPTAAEGNAQAVRLTVPVTGSATATLTPESRTQIADTVAGSSEADAKAYLATLGGIDGYEIRYAPGWLPHRIPSSSARVRVETR
jgi:hypothetical protein